jgi:hypothetical protein
VAEKTVFAGRHEAQLPPVPVSVPALAPKRAPVSASVPSPVRPAPVVQPPPGERSPAAVETQAVPEHTRSSRPVLQYLIVVLGLVVLAGAGIALFLHKS